MPQGSLAPCRCQLSRLMQVLRSPSLPAPCSAHLPSLGKSLSHLAVATAVAGSDEISHPAALQEGGGGDGALAEEFGEADHLHQSQTDNRSLRVVPEAETITETSPYSHDVLQDNSTERSVPARAQGFATSTSCPCDPQSRLLPAPACLAAINPSEEPNRTHTAASKTWPFAQASRRARVQYPEEFIQVAASSPELPAELRLC